MTMPGSCSSGLRSRPSAAAGSSRSKGVGGEQREEQEPHRDERHHRQDARHNRQRQVPAVQGHGHLPQRQHQEPQEQRALVPAPHACHPVGQRQLAVGVLGHIQHREVVDDEGRRQAGIRHHRDGKQRHRAGLSESHPASAAGLRTHEGHHAQHPCQRQRDPQRKVTDLHAHCCLLKASSPARSGRTWHHPSWPFPGPRRPRAACSSRRAWPAPRGRRTRRLATAPAPPPPCPP